MFAVLVKVGKVSESGKPVDPVREFAVYGNKPTVGDALGAAGYKTKGLTSQHVRVNGDPASLDDQIGAGSVVLLVPLVKGG